NCTSFIYMEDANWYVLGSSGLKYPCASLISPLICSLSSASNSGFLLFFSTIDEYSDSNSASKLSSLADCSATLESSSAFTPSTTSVDSVCSVESSTFSSLSSAVIAHEPIINTTAKAPKNFFIIFSLLFFCLIYYILPSQRL